MIRTLINENDSNIEKLPGFTVKKQPQKEKSLPNFSSITDDLPDFEDDENTNSSNIEKYFHNIR